MKQEAELPAGQHEASPPESIFGFLRYVLFEALQI